MTADEERAIKVALESLRTLLDIYKFERFFYLAAAVGGAALALWATALWIQHHGAADGGQIGLMFGATGGIALSSGLVVSYMSRGFAVVEKLIDRLGAGQS